MTNLRRVFVEVFQICHIFNFANIRYVVKVIFFLSNSTGKFTLSQNFVISFFTLTYVPLD